MNTWATGLSANDSRLISFVPGELTLLLRRPGTGPRGDGASVPEERPAAVNASDTADGGRQIARREQPPRVIPDVSDLRRVFGDWVQLHDSTPLWSGGSPADPPGSGSFIHLDRGGFGQYALLTVNLSSWTPRPIGAISDEDMYNSIDEARQAVPWINTTLLQHPREGYRGAGTSNRDFTSLGPRPTVNFGPAGDWELLAASPNWLASSVCGWGGPAGGPVVPQPGVELLRFLDRDVQTEVQAGLDVINRLCDRPPVRWQGNRGSLPGAESVKIAIFDTWPWTPGAYHDSSDYWLAALKACRSRVERLGGNISRLNAFIDGEIQLTVEDRVYGRIAAVHTHPNLRGYLEGSYVQRDHGLFVADIISDIVPNAEIVVYRVLNDYGIGDMQTIALAAADAVETESSERPIVMNFSLSIGPRLPILVQYLENPLDAYLDGPGLAQDAYNLIGAAPDEDLCAATLRNPACWPVQILHSVPTLPNVFAVASAGNDSDRDRGRIAPARMPAAIEGVLAVTASVAGGKEADYASQPDIEKETDDATMAFGGATDDESGFTVDERGGAPVRLYVTDNLSRDGNARGIAQWAGTSFAAPIASGIAACIWSEVLSAFGGPIENFPSIANPTKALFPAACDLLTAVVKRGSEGEGHINLRQPWQEQYKDRPARRGWHWPWSRSAR